MIDDLHFTCRIVAMCFDQRQLQYGARMRTLVSNWLAKGLNWIALYGEIALRQTASPTSYSVGKITNSEP